VTVATADHRLSGIAKEQVFPTLLSTDGVGEAKHGSKIVPVRFVIGILLSRITTDESIGAARAQDRCEGVVHISDYRFHPNSVGNRQGRKDFIANAQQERKAGRHLPTVLKIERVVGITERLEAPDRLKG